MSSRTQHKASCLVQIQVFDTEKGTPVSHSELAQFGLRPKMTVEVIGDTKEITLQRLKELIDAFSR